jgi:hypothetical protein
MMLIRKIVFCLSAIILLFSTPVFSQNMPLNAVVIEKIVDVLHKNGYLGIRKLKYQDKVYVIDAFTDQGQRVKIRIDPTSYTILNPSDKTKILSLSEIAQKIEAFGFNEIYKIEPEDEGYLVIASNAKRKKVLLFIDASTGKITDSIFNYLK